jgi:putative transposase
MKTGINTSGYQALRRHRYSSPNQIYLITFTTNKRQLVFFDNDQAARAFCVALNDPMLWHEATLMCWVLMYDHVHLLVQIGDTESISRLINRLKANTARKVNMVLGKKDRFWEKGFHDRAIRSEENIVDIARYIVMNPIRAGFVKSAGMYPYWNAIWL